MEIDCWDLRESESGCESEFSWLAAPHNYITFAVVRECFST